MSNYFSQFIPGFGNPKYKEAEIKEVVSEMNSKLKYLMIINPKLVSSDVESNEELIKQNICFISNVETSLTEKLKLIGLIRGIDLFGREFVTTTNINSNNKINNNNNNDTTNNNDNNNNIDTNNNNNDNSSLPTIIQSSKSSIISIKVESDYYIACSVVLPTDNVKYGYINSQLIKLIQQAYRQFILHYNNFNFNIKSNNFSNFNHYWSNFFHGFNNSNYNFPINWPNGLNYRGFLGLLPKNTFKRSSLNFGSNSQQEIDILMKGTGIFTPKGIVIAYFDKSNPKKYGLIYKNSLTIDDDNLIDLYNWLEYHDYQGNLTSTNGILNDFPNEFYSNAFQNVDATAEITSSDEATGHIDSSEPGRAMSERVIDSTTTATSAAMDMLNPMNLTSNLVILPLNYTVTGMKTLHGMFINSNEANSSSEATNGENEATQSTPAGATEPQPYSWLSIPPLLKNLHFRGSESTETDIDTEIETPGDYLVGWKSSDGDENKIYKKLVYFNGIEHSLVIYRKEDIYITLIYDFNAEKLDNPKFYQTLQEEILDPSIEEISQTCLNASVNGSLASLKSLNKYMQAPLDSDFFFVIYDVEAGWFKSSLPYLPLQLDSKLSNAMIYLHDQLTGLFVVDNNRDFFLKQNLMNEYFHKFTSSKSSDWMFYCIRHKSKIILIVKNQNRNKPIKKIQPDETGLMGKFAGAVNLGFLDNLGDDVKSWLEIFSTNGEV